MSDASHGEQIQDRVRRLARLSAVMRSSARSLLRSQSEAGPDAPTLRTAATLFMAVSELSNREITGICRERLSRR